MSSAWDATGVVHLHDLANRYRWETRKLPAYLGRLGMGDPLVKAPPGQFVTSSFAPPRRLVVLNRGEDGELWRQYRGWLSQAFELHLVLCHHQELGIEERHQLERDTFSALEGLPLVRLLHWNSKDPAPEPLRFILEGSEKLGWPEANPLPQGDVAAPGAWIELPDPPGFEPELRWPRWVCRREGGRPSLFYPTTGSFLDLGTGDWSDSVAPMTDSTFLTVWPDGSHLLSSNYRGEFSLLDLSSGRLRRFRGPHGAPVGVWPGARVGWAGARCVFSWLSTGGEEPGTLSACDHDWPCGHEKKQYGHLDNEPCWIHLSGLADAYLSVYQKDAVVSGTPPIGWRSFGSAWAATEEPAADPSRALFYSFLGDLAWGDPSDAENGDARDARPVIALGPDPHSRYALDLRTVVYRVAGSSVAERVNEPVDAYAVFDASHQPKRYGSGRLLGGWDRWLTGIEDGRLWRDDFVSGERTDLGPEAEEISWAFPVPGSANLVLVQADEGRGRLRLV